MIVILVVLSNMPSVYLLYNSKKS